MVTSKYLDISLEDCGLQKIVFNRPERKNALDGEMIKSITSILRESARDPTVRVTAFSGNGDYFTSGNDLSNFFNSGQNESEDHLDMNELLQRGRKLFQEFVAAFIDYPKPLIALVNGPAVGIGVTILSHFDLIFASNLATFHCPFVTLGQTPEGCSSLLFPSLMGHSKASELLLFGKKISAKEAYERNLVTEVVNHNSLLYVWDRIRAVCSLPPDTLMNAKSVLKSRLIPHLHKSMITNAIKISGSAIGKVNNEECDFLCHQWISEEFTEALMKFMKGKSKL